MSTETMDAGNPGARFHEVFESGGAAGRPYKGGLADRQRDRLVREEWQRLARRQWDPVELFNFHPWPMRVDLGELGLILIPAATGDEPGRARLDLPRISMRDLGDGNFVPVSVLPNELAQEVERECRVFGGVLWTRAGEAPSEWQVEEARERRMSWYREEYRKAVNAWARHRQHQFITDRQRDAARALLAAGEIDHLPEWIAWTRRAAVRVECPECGEEIRATARICRFCRSPLAPPEEQGEASPRRSTGRRASARLRVEAEPPAEAE